MPSDNHSKYGLILLGNTGVGKSFIGNVILGRDAFEHECSSSSVTHETEFEDYAVGSESFAVFNIPGLIEAEQEAVDRNKEEIYKAFQQRPNSVVAFVFNGGSGGRISDQDVIAFKAINDAYHFESESLLFIVNDLPLERSPKYEGETAMRLERLAKVSNMRICFLNRINKKTLDNSQHTGLANAAEASNSSGKKHGVELVGKKFQDAKNFFKKHAASPSDNLQQQTPELSEREIMRRKLMDAIMCCTPRVHEKQNNIELGVDKMKSLIEDNKKMQHHFEEERAKLQTDIDQRQKQFEEYKRQMEAQPREVHHHHERIVERNNENGGLGGLLGLVSPVFNLLSRLF